MTSICDQLTVKAVKDFERKSINDTVSLDNLCLESYSQHLLLIVYSSHICAGGIQQIIKFTR
jgi:hypothetical protein